MVKERRIDKILILFCFVILFSFGVLAADVAYVYKSSSNIDKKVLEVFSDLGMSVDKIQERNIRNNLSSYKLLYIGDESFSNPRKIPFGKIPTIVSNYYYGDMWGLTDNDGMSKLTSNSPLRINENGKKVKVYSRSRDRVGKGLSYYYIANSDKGSKIGKKIAGVYTGSLNYDLGDVISYFENGAMMGNKKIINGNVCFFGLIESDYWTSASKKLFKECAEFVSDIDDEENIPGRDPKPKPEPTPEPVNMTGKLVHDIGFVNFTNAINMIRIENESGFDILGNKVICKEKYKIGLTILNKGNFSENVSFMGSIGSLEFNHLPIVNFEAQDKKLKTKTINITLNPGDYKIRIIANITGFKDSYVNDNIIEREVKVICS